MRKNAVLMAMLGVGVLAGCATHPFAGKYGTPTKEEIAEANEKNLHGPAPENPEAIVREYLRTVLFDPYSVQDFQVGPVDKGCVVYNAASIWDKRLLLWGWRAPVTFNAKNRYGGYTGLKTKWVLIKDGLVIWMEDD